MSLKNIATTTALVSSLCLPAISLAEEAPLTVDIKRLSLETAMRIGQAAIAECRKQGVQIAVTVVDRGGHPQVVLRDVLAMDITVPISKQKAHTALAFNSVTSTLEGRFKGAYSVPKLDNLVISAGGVPVNVGGTIMAGIGVSGAPDGKIDEACAKAGLEAVKDDLELAG